MQSWPSVQGLIRVEEPIRHHLTRPLVTTLAVLPNFWLRKIDEANNNLPRLVV